MTRFAAARAQAIQAVDVTVPADEVALEGNLSIPERCAGIVLFAHGSGSSRLSPRNRMVARLLNEGGLATLLVDLLTAQEQEVDERTAALRFDIGLLTRRLIGAVDWLGERPETRELRVALFGASTGAAAALAAAAERPERVAAVVSRGGRPDLALPALPRVRAPTLLIVGGRDRPVTGMNRQAEACLTCEHRPADIDLDQQGAPGREIASKGDTAGEGMNHLFVLVGSGESRK